MKITIIGNPISSGGDTKTRMAKLQRLLEERGHLVTSFLTRFAGDGRNEISRLSKNMDRVVVVGGDGTFNEIISGLSEGSSVPLLHFPSGNANLMGKDLGLPKKEEQVAGLLENGRILMADVGMMNGQKFIMVAGMGFDARVTEEMKKIRKGKVSNLTYVLPMIRALSTTENAVFRVTVDDDPAVYRGKAVIVANVRTYGGICEIAHKAGISTGRLDVVVLPEENAAAVVKYLLYAKFFKIDLLKNVTYLQGEKIRIESDIPIPVELDGDFNGRHDRVEIGVIPASVPLVAP